MRRLASVAVAALGIGTVAGLAVTPAAAVSRTGSHLPHYVTSKLGSSASRPSGYLGTGVAISGRTVVVDADGTRVHGKFEAGAVYVFTRSPSGKGRLTQRAVLSVPGEESNDEVGAVAVSGDTIVVGARYATVGTTVDAGAAYVFEKPKSGWKTTSHPNAKLTLGTAVSDANVGASVAIAGNTIAVGAPYQTIGTNSEQGVVLVYTKKPSHQWASSSNPAELTSSSGMQDDDLGQSVAISGDTIVAGAPDREVTGHDDAGIADVFVKPHNGGWATKTETRELAPSPTLSEADFGIEVAASRGHVAASTAGDTEISNIVHPTVFEFNEPAGGWGNGSDPPLHQKAKLTPAQGGPYDGFGLSVAISSSMVVVGAPYASLDRKYESGAAYVFVKPKKGWHNAKQSTQFIAANTERWDSFGYSVAVSGSTIVAGAPYSDYTGVHNSVDRGTAYIFTKRHQHARTTIEAAK